MPSTPILPLHVESGIVLLQLRRQLLDRKFVLKLKAKESPLLDKISRLASLDLVNKYWQHKNSPPLCEAFRETAYLLPNVLQFHIEGIDRNFFELTPHPNIIVPTYCENTTINKNTLCNILDKYSDYTIAYTDGSKSSYGTGCAALVPQRQISLTYKLPDICSIFSAEAYAIDQTLDILCETEGKVAIVSDSLSFLRLIQTSSPPLENIHPIVRRIKSKLCVLRNQGIEIVFIWVKAHAGILYNKKVDKLAKEAAQGTNYATHLLCLGDCVNAIKKDILKLWQDMYQQYRSNTTTQYCSIQEEIPAKPWYKNINVSRTYISMYSRLRFGQGRYPAFLAKIGMADSDMCEQCQDVATTLSSVAENGFVLSREAKNFDSSTISNPDVVICTIHETPTECLVLLKKQSKEQPTNIVQITDTETFPWIKRLKNLIKLNPDEDILLYAEKEPLSGILGLVNCLRREPESRNVKALFLMDIDKTFNPRDPFFANQLKKNMVMNVLKEGKWGTYRHLLLSNLEEIENEHFTANLTIRGDLSTLKWLEGPLSHKMKVPPEKSIVYVSI
nr:unnamed protein product [Callosobruchus analis]